MRSGTDVCENTTGRARDRSRSSCARRRVLSPPSIEALEARLNKRGQDAPAVIARRLLASRSEIEHAPEFDFIVINEDFDLALSQLVAIVTATRLRYSTQMARHRALFTQLGIG